MAAVFRDPDSVPEPRTCVSTPRRGGLIPVKSVSSRGKLSLTELSLKQEVTENGGQPLLARWLGFCYSIYLLFVRLFYFN